MRRRLQLALLVSVLIMLNGCLTYSKGTSYGASLDGVGGIVDTLMGKKPPPMNDMEALLRAREGSENDSGKDVYYREVKTVEMGFGPSPESSETSTTVKRPSNAIPSAHSTPGGG